MERCVCCKLEKAYLVNDMCRLCNAKVSYGLSLHELGLAAPDALDKFLTVDAVVTEYQRITECASKPTSSLRSPLPTTR
jgi:hypothetical protein